MCTETELRIVSVTSQKQLQSLLSCSPCCQTPLPQHSPGSKDTTALGNQNQHEARVFLQLPRAQLAPQAHGWVPPSSLLRAPPLWFCSFLPASGWVCSTHFCGIQVVEEALPCAALRGQLQLGVLVLLSLPLDPQQIFLSQFPGENRFSTIWAPSWKAIKGRGWFNQGCLSATLTQLVKLTCFVTKCLFPSRQC